MTKSATLLEGEERVWGGTPMAKSLKWVRGPQDAPIWCVSACVRAHVYSCQDPFNPPLPRVQRKLISVLFFSPEDKAHAQCPASFSSAEREFWGTETEGQVITKGLAVDLVVDFIWKSNSATAFGEVCHFYMCEGTDCVAVGRTYNIKLHVSFFHNLPRHKWRVVTTSVLFNGKPVSGVFSKIQRPGNLILSAFGQDVADLS